MANSGDINVGTVIRFNGELCKIEEYQHRTPGNLRAFYQARMRNLKNGKIVASTKGLELSYKAVENGAYRVEVRIKNNPWIYSNHIRYREVE